MYSDHDGTASKESEAIYQNRKRALCAVTSVLSLIGVTAFTLSGGYAKDDLAWRKPFLLAKILWPVLSIHSLDLYRIENPVAVYTAGLRGSLVSVIIVLSQFFERIPLNETSFLNDPLISVQIAAALALAVIQIQFPRRPDVFTDGRPVDFENTCTAFQRYTMHWCSGALYLAGNPPAGDTLGLGRLPTLNYGTRSKAQPLIVLSETSLWNHVLWERYLGFAKQWALMLTRSVVTFGSPYCIMRMLQCLEENSGQTNIGWLWLVGITAFSTADTILHYHLAWIQWSEMGIPIRAQLITAIFFKALRVKDSKDTGDRPEAINLISSDTLSFSKFTAVNYILPFSLIKFLFAILFLLRLLGWKSTMVAVLATVGTVPIQSRILKQERAAKKRLTAARDRKTKAVTEALQAVRQIKFSALETQWEERIELCRQEELKEMRKRSIAVNIRLVWKVASPLIVAAAAICSYAYTQNEVSSSIVFTMIELLPHIQGTLGTVPMVVQDYYGAQMNSQRMETYLKSPELEQVLTTSPTGAVSFKNSRIAWPSSSQKADSPEQFILHDLNVDFPIGELSIIHGETGSGKSLMLAAILGEVELLDGRIEVPSLTKPVAFVSQTPWLQNATIKDNILFGAPLDETRYQKVLTACALDPDLAALPKGDQTYVGLRGVRLSGGQRARVSLGRALYSNADLLVMDDIFSALDAHVSKEIFKAMTGELGQGRTRILATHHVSLCLPQAKHIVCIKNNTMEYSEKAALMKDKFAAREPEKPIQITSPPEKPSTTAKEMPKPKVKAKAKSNESESEPDFYRNYFGAAGGLRFAMVYTLGLLGKQLMSALTTWILGRINSQRPKTTADLLDIANTENNLWYHLYAFLLGSLFSIILEFLVNVHMFSGSLRASETLFRAMTRNVLRMPLLWLDNTPIGPILKRFSGDIRMVDDLLLEALSEFANCIVKLIIVVYIGVRNSVYTSCLALALFFWSLQVSKGYVKARKPVKSGESGGNADILECFTTAASGVSTIRAFRVTDKFLDQMHVQVDKLSIARRHFWIFNRWLGLQMSFMGIILSTGTGIILLSSKSVLDPSLVGFSLTFSMGFAHASFTAVNNFGLLEGLINAAVGIISYSKLQTERQDGDDVPIDWPSRGDVEVKDLSIAYSPDLPLVLKDVSFSVGAGQRIGIVGRTGAGKSSLTLALLRLIEPQHGSILIDGVDISTIKVQSLRSKIAFIPQDPVLFSGTVRDNLDYFKEIPTHTLSNVLSRVKLLAEGEKKTGLFTLDSPISAGGANMSQGQRQLLCLAGVLIKSPKVIILDEATSAVDNETDIWIQDTIRKEFDRTLIVVAHRLRTIASFDKLIVIDDGRIGEIGTPAELLRAKGQFYDLVQKSEDKEFVINSVLESRNGQ